MVKELPHDDVAEKTLLGTCLIDAKEAANIISAIDEEDFYAENMKNRLIYRAMRKLYESGVSIDVTTVFSQLQNTKDDERVGGLDYLVGLCDNVVSLSRSDYYVEILHQKKILRQLLTEIAKIEKDYETKKIEDVNEFIGEVESRINKITENRKVGDFSTMGTLARTVGEQIRSAHGREDSISGYPTGFQYLDSKLNGLGKGELVILAARPAVGKSALALNMAYNVAAETQKPVALFSLEMADDMILKRLFASRTHIDFKSIQNGYLTTEQRQKIREAENDFVNVPLYIDSFSGNSIDDIELKARKLKENKDGLALVVVDYIGLINDPKNIYKDNEQAKIAYFSRRLKVLAGELKCPVLCLAQLNRQTEESHDKRPTMANLRSSGAIEADADKVLFIYRPGYYLDQGIEIKKKENKSFGQGTTPTQPNDQKTDVVEIIIAKNRNGDVGTVELFFMKEYGKFFTPSNADYEKLTQAKEITSLPTSDMETDN